MSRWCGSQRPKHLMANWVRALDVPSLVKATFPRLGVLNKCTINGAFYKDSREKASSRFLGWFILTDIWRTPPGHSDCVPTTRVLGHSTHRMILLFSHSTCLLVKYEQLVGKQHESTWLYNKHWRIFQLVSHLPPIGGHQSSSQYLHKWIVPTTWQVSTSDVSWSKTPVTGSQLDDIARHFWGAHMYTAP